MSEERDQAVAEEPIVAAEAEAVADEASAQGEDQTPELDDDGNPIVAAVEDDTEEIEHDGEKYKVPAKLKEAFLRQADYTRKTQEVAEHRKALETERQTLAQQAEAREATLEQRVQLAQLDQALEQYQALDWAAYEREHGPGAVAAATVTWRQLEAAKGTLSAEITAKEAEARTASEQVTANAIREAEQVLARDVQGFGPDLVTKVAHAAATFGFTADELRDSFVGADGKADIRTFQALAELAELRAFKAKHDATNNKAKVAQKIAAVQPAVSVTPNAGQYKAGLDDNLPMDEWQRRRDAQLAKAGRR